MKETTTVATKNAEFEKIKQEVLEWENRVKTAERLTTHSREILYDAYTKCKEQKKPFIFDINDGKVHVMFYMDEDKYFPGVYTLNVITDFDKCKMRFLADNVKRDGGRMVRKTASRHFFTEMNIYLHILPKYREDASNPSITKEMLTKRYFYTDKYKLAY